MSSYKIKKYTYKLENAKNKKDAAIYKAKLDSYKRVQAGGEIKEEEVRKMINDAFTGSEQQIANLADQFNTVVDEIKKKCCEKKDCSPETLAQIAKLEEEWKLIMNRELLNKDREMSKKLSEQKEILEKKMKEPCLESVSKVQIEKPLEQKLLDVDQSITIIEPKDELFPPLEDLLATPAIPKIDQGSERLSELQAAAKKQAEAVAQMTANPLLGGKRKKGKSKK